MSTQEQVSKLQGLLERIKRNQALPRTSAPARAAAPAPIAAPVPFTAPSPVAAPVATRPAPVDASVDDLLAASSEAYCPAW